MKKTKVIITSLHQRSMEDIMRDRELSNLRHKKEYMMESWPVAIELFVDEKEKAEFQEVMLKELKRIDDRIAELESGAKVAEESTPQNSSESKGDSAE